MVELDDVIFVAVVSHHHHQQQRQHLPFGELWKIPHRQLLMIYDLSGVEHRKIGDDEKEEEVYHSTNGYGVYS